MKPTIVKVGRITVALGLVAFGVAMLLDNFAATRDYVAWIFRLWPLILIGFGIEYLIRTVLAQQAPEGSAPVTLRLDVGGAFLLFLVIVLSVGIASFRTWTADWNVGRFPFVNVGGRSISQSQQGSYALDGAKAVRIDVPVGSITIDQGNSADEVQVEAEFTAHGFVMDSDAVVRELERIKLDVIRGDPLALRVDIPKDLDNISISFTVHLPPGLKVRAENGAGRIQVSTYQGDLDLHSGAGTIFVGSGGGSLNASSGAGRIQVQQFDGPVSAKASVGTLSIANVIGSIQADTGTGSIDVRNFQGGKLVAESRTGRLNVFTDAPLAGDVILKASAGSINLTVPRSSSMRVTAQTRAGGLSVPDFMTSSGTGPVRSGIGTNLDGKYTVSLEAGTGSIQFTTR